MQRFPSPLLSLFSYFRLIHGDYMMKGNSVSNIWVSLPLVLGFLGGILSYYLDSVFPIFLGFIGGIIAYWMTADNNKDRANKFLLTGAFTSIMIAFLLALFAMVFSR